MTILRITVRFSVLLNVADMPEYETEAHDTMPGDSGRLATSAFDRWGSWRILLTHILLTPQQSAQQASVP